MIYVLQNDTLKPFHGKKTPSLTQNEKHDAGAPQTGLSKLPPDQKLLAIIDYDELAETAAELKIQDRVVQDCLSGKTSKFESHLGFDFVILNVPVGTVHQKAINRICMVMTDSLLLFICHNNHVILGIVQSIEAHEIKNVSLGKILHLFFDRLTFDDSLELEKIEQEITNLEDLLVGSKQIDFRFLTIFRKKLLTLKLYYEQLLEIYEGLDQNENGLIELKELRYFKIQEGRANRLYNGVLNLRDYVTQVREALQTQTDIRLNSVMKVFTVITSVFFPLTLIVGWYGMNLQMPEFKWQYGYPFVISLIVVTALLIILYLRKKKLL